MCAKGFLELQPGCLAKLSNSTCGSNVAPVTVIIVNWNSGGYLAECLLHLGNQTVQPQAVLVVDNNSTDDSVLGAIGVAGLTVLRMQENLGFAAANNYAIELCSTEFIALLNPDAFPEPDWLECLLSAAQAYPQVVAFGSRQLCRTDTDLLDGAGDIYHMSGAVWRGRYRQYQEKRDLIARRIFSACAAAALYRRKPVLDVGGFDTDYFCYVEDVDLGFRLRLAGWEARYVPDAVVQHVGAASSGGQHSDFAVYHGHRNLVWTFIKNMPGLLFWILLPLHMLLNLITVIYFCFHGQGAVVVRAKWDAIGGLGAAWRKREAIQTSRVASIFIIWEVIDKRLLPLRNRS